MIAAKPPMPAPRFTRWMPLIAMAMGVVSATAWAEGGAVYSFTFEDHANQNRWDQDESWKRHGSVDGSADGIAGKQDTARINATFNTSIKLNGAPRELGHLQIEVAQDNTVAIAPDKDGGTKLTIHGNLTKTGAGTLRIEGYYQGSMHIGGDLLLEDGVVESPGTQHQRGTLSVGGKLALIGGKLKANRLVLGEAAVVRGTLAALAEGITMADFTEEAKLTLTPGAKLEVTGLGDLKPEMGQTIVLVSGFNELAGRFAGLDDHATLTVEGVTLAIVYLPNRIELRVLSAAGQ